MSTTQNRNKMDRESIAAEKIARKGNPPQDVLSWLHQAHSGTLSTLNTREETHGLHRILPLLPRLRELRRRLRLRAVREGCLFGILL